jgi:hemolysin activation/secretion protein
VLLVMSGAGPRNAAAATPQTLEINEYTVEGNHLLTEDEVDTAVYPYLGPGQTIQSVDAARAALQKAYADKGYQTVGVEIPPQHVMGGVVVLQVIEEPVGHLHVNGSRYFSLNEIKSEAPSLAPGKVPNFKKIPHDIIALNDWPDRQVTPTLQAGVKPRTVDVGLNVKDSLPLHASLELNNRYNQSTTPLRINASVSYDNLFQLGHAISLSFQIAPQRPDDAEVFSGSYLARIPNVDWLTLLLYGLDSNSNVSTVGNTNVIGKGQVIGARAILSLPGGAGFYQTLSAGIDYKHFDQDVGLSGSSLATPVTYYPVTATYSASWQGATGLTQFDFGPTFNIRNIGSNPSEFDAKRYSTLKTASGFIYVRGDLSRTQDLPGGYQLFAKIQGQLSNQPLVNSEEFSVGGLDTVRGYLESEVLGDDAILGSVEIQTPSLAQFLGPKVNDWRLFAFSEGGQANILEPLSQQQAVFNLASLGIGSTIQLINHLNGAVDFSLPLVTSVVTKAYQPRVEFRVWVEF